MKLNLEKSFLAILVILITCMAISGVSASEDFDGSADLISDSAINDNSLENEISTSSAGDNIDNSMSDTGFSSDNVSNDVENNKVTYSNEDNSNNVVNNDVTYSNEDNSNCVENGKTTYFSDDVSSLTSPTEITNVILPENVSGKPGQNLIIPVTITDKNNNTVPVNNVTVTFPDNSNVIVSFDKVSVTVKLPEDVTNGEIVVTYPGDDTYYSSNSTTIFNVTKLDTTLTLPGSVTGKPGEIITIPVNITDENGNQVIRSEVTVTFPDNSSVTVPVEKDSVNVNLPEDITDGEIKVIYLGNDKYNLSNSTTIFNVSILDTNVTLPESVTGKPGENITIEVNVTDEFGNPVTCDNLTVTFPDGTTAEVTYDGTSITVPLPDGITDGELNVSYLGNDKYNPSFGSTIFNLSTIDTNVTLPESVTGKPGENITIEVNVTDEFGNPVTCDNLTVTFPDGTTAEVTYDGTSITVPLPDGITDGELNVSYLLVMINTIHLLDQLSLI